MKPTLLFVGILLTLLISLNTFTQTPQYYNANSGGIGNSLPFNSPSGYMTQWLIGPGEYVLPSAAPMGSVTKFYIYMSSIGGPATYSNLLIRMGQGTTINSFSPGLYTGQLDTVYFRASVQLSSTANTWLGFTLDKTFFYNPAQSLVIEASHCGYTGPGMSIWQSPGTTGIIRRNNIPGTTSCIFTYSSQDTRTLQNGLDIVPAVVRCRNGINVPIPDLSNARDSVQVSIGSGCTVFDVDVVIDTLIHTFVSDMIIYLRKGPVGVRIFNRSGGGGDNFIGTILDDEAPFNNGPPPFTGRFRPNTPLAPFDSQATDGYWRLHISDTVGGDSGFLKAWCVAVSYRCPLGGIQTVEIPNHYILKQNYPNPFNPVTSIKYGLPKGQLVKLVVFDVLGREVVTLVNEFKPPGVYEANFDASNYASGIYFYKLETADFAETKKMILIK